MEKNMSLVEVLLLLRKKMKLLVGSAVLGLIVTAVYTFFIVVPQYSSTTQILVNRTREGEEIRESDIYTHLNLIGTYKDIIQSPVVLDDVQETLNMNIPYEDLRDRLEVSSTDTSQVFLVRATDADPVDAANLANTVAETFRTKINEIMSVENVTIISQAIPNADPVTPNTMLNLALGIVIGLFAGVVLTFFMELMDNTIKSDDFISEQLGWSNLGHLNQLSSKEIKKAESQLENEQETYTSNVKSRV